MAMEFAVRLLALALVESVFGAPAEARALAQSHHGCDSVGRVALMPNHIGRKLEAQLEADIKRSGSQADGIASAALCYRMPRRVLRRDPDWKILPPGVPWQYQ